MHDAITVLRVFVASPSDLSDERDRLADVIDEINVTWGKYLQTYLELVTWEGHSFPGIGDDPQDVINKQIADDYDIFVGILWTRFGTATRRAQSGTVEEFNRAYRRYTENPDLVRIMFYFSQVATAPGDVDPTQLALVNEFRRTLGDQGVLWWSYGRRKEFETSVRIHLSRQMQERGKTWGLAAPGASLAKKGGLRSSSKKRSSAQPELSETLTELLDSGKQRMRVLIETLTSMLGQMTSQNERMSTWVQEIAQMYSLPVEQQPEWFRQVGYHAADGMAEFVTSMEAQIPAFSESYAGAVDVLTRAALRLPIAGVQDQRRAKQAIELLKTAGNLLGKLATTFGKARDHIDKWYAITPAFSFVKSHVVSLLGRLCDEIERAANLTSESEELLRETAGAQGRRGRTRKQK